LIMSCPPKVDQMQIHLPQGHVIPMAQSDVFRGHDEPFGADMDEKAAWLKVPLVNTTGAGTFDSHLPAPELSLLSTLFMDVSNAKYLSEVKHAKARTGYYQQTKVVDANGQVISRVTTEGDGFTIAEIEIADHTPEPEHSFPTNPYTPLAYLLSDVILPTITTPFYRQGYRRVYGSQMAPYSDRTKFIFIAFMTVVLLWIFRKIIQR
jgi:hypothetical protein